MIYDTSTQRSAWLDKITNNKQRILASTQHNTVSVYNTTLSVAWQQTTHFSFNTTQHSERFTRNQVLAETAPGVDPGGEVRRQEWCCGPTAPGESGGLVLIAGVTHILAGLFGVVCLYMIRWSAWRQGMCGEADSTLRDFGRQEWCCGPTAPGSAIKRRW
jgi:hypothetical protein